MHLSWHCLRLDPQQLQQVASFKGSNLLQSLLECSVLERQRGERLRKGALAGGGECLLEEFATKLWLPRAAPTMRAPSYASPRYAAVGSAPLLFQLRICEAAQSKVAVPTQDSSPLSFQRKQGKQGGLSKRGDSVWGDLSSCWPFSSFSILSSFSQESLFFGSSLILLLFGPPAVATVCPSSLATFRRDREASSLHSKRLGLSFLASLAQVDPWPVVAAVGLFSRSFCCLDRSRQDPEETKPLAPA